MRPRRSVLYMPGANARAMEKARSLDCDTIVFDLEDAVAPDAKDIARTQVLAAVAEGGYGHRELVVRSNGLDTPWGAADIEAFAAQPIAALLFPKIESLAQVERIATQVQQHGGADLPLWLMVETPAGVLDLDQFAGHPRVAALVMGTSDLVKELRAQHTVARHNLDYALQQCIMVARRHGREIFDGVHLDFQNDVSLRAVCEGGRAMGFDGKTLIHPSQITIANEVFGYAPAEIEQARRLLDVWQAALAAGKGVAVLDGKLVENLHAAEAERVVAFADAIAARDAG